MINRPISIFWMRETTSWEFLLSFAILCIHNLMESFPSARGYIDEKVKVESSGELSENLTNSNLKLWSWFKREMVTFKFWNVEFDKFKILQLKNYFIKNFIKLLKKIPSWISKTIQIVFACNIMLSISGFWHRHKSFWYCFIRYCAALTFIETRRRLYYASQ